MGSVCGVGNSRVTHWYSSGKSGKPLPFPFFLFETFPFQVALPAKGFSRRRPVVASEMRSQPLPHVPGSRAAPPLLESLQRRRCLGPWARWGREYRASSPSSASTLCVCRKRLPSRPFTLFSSSAQVLCDSHRAQEPAGAVALAAATSATARNAPRPRYIPGKVRAGG